MSNYPGSPAYSALNVEEGGGNVPEKSNFRINEQSTVSVLVASAFCCCFLLLSVVASAVAFLFLLIWGAYILDGSDSATSTSCEDAYHVWTFCLMNEFVGLAVTVCGCGEACRIYQSMTSENESTGSSAQGCGFLVKYIGIFLVTFCFFCWGMVEWFSVTNGCIMEYDKKYEALMLLFRTGVIADAIILLLTVTCFVIQRSAAFTKDDALTKDSK